MGGDGVSDISAEAGEGDGEWGMSYMPYSPSHKLPDSTPDHIRRQFETAYHNLSSNPDTPLVSTSVNPHIQPSPQRH